MNHEHNRDVKARNSDLFVIQNLEGIGQDTVGRCTEHALAVRLRSELRRLKLAQRNTKFYTCGDFRLRFTIGLTPLSLGNNLI